MASNVAHCATCHSIDLSGIDIAPGLKGAGFRFRWGGSSLNDIYLSLRSTMPQASPGSLSREVYVDLIAYLLEANNYPTGNLELTPDEALLDAIQVDRKPS
jgi:quinoprotein glucose dehydrogenase